MIIQVLVNHSGGAPYVCRLDRVGKGRASRPVWRCGKCRRGNLGGLPQRGQLCRVCLARVMSVESVP